MLLLRTVSIFCFFSAVFCASLESSAVAVTVTDSVNACERPSMDGTDSHEYSSLEQTIAGDHRVTRKVNHFIEMDDSLLRFMHAEISAGNASISA